MKAIYPWAEMQIGDVREVSTHRSRKAVYSAGWEWARKHKNRNEDGSRPKFDVEKVVTLSMITTGTVDAEVSTYRIERTA